MIEHLELYAWVGEDEFGSGEVGLKQAIVPAGNIPLVATTEAKMNQHYIVDQMKRQAKCFGKTIRLVKFVSAGTVLEVKP